MDKVYEDKDSIFFHVSLGIANGKVVGRRKRTKEKMHHKVVEGGQQIQTRKKTGYQITQSLHFPIKTKKKNSSSQKSHE